jgi:hypothetical protein
MVLRTSLFTLSTLSFHTYISEPRTAASAFLPPSLLALLICAYLERLYSYLSVTSVKHTFTTDKMLQFSQQRAVSYPTFPGNVQALSIPSSSLEPLQKPPPSPPPSPSPTLTTMMQHLESSTSLGKPKRRQTLAACRHCRRRKSKVDSPRPKPTKFQPLSSLF